MSPVAHGSAMKMEKMVAESETPVLVDFYADWCGPCRAMAPVLDKLAVEMAGRASILKINVDEEPELAARFRINSIPTLILFHAGRAVKTLVGLRPPAELRKLLQDASDKSRKTEVRP